MNPQCRAYVRMYLRATKRPHGGHSALFEGPTYAGYHEIYQDKFSRSTEIHQNKCFQEFLHICKREVLFHEYPYLIAIAPLGFIEGLVSGLQYFAMCFPHMRVGRNSD